VSKQRTGEQRSGFSEYLIVSPLIYERGIYGPVVVRLSMIEEGPCGEKTV